MADLALLMHAHPPMRLARHLVLKPHSYFHMMWRAHNREYIMQSHAEKLRYLRAVRDDYMKKCKKEHFVLHGYTIMSNHAHVNGQTNDDHKPYSEHMRRAHSRFGYSYNRRHHRLGAVAHDRPTIKASQEEAYSIQVMLYDHFNPVRAHLIPHPTHVKWKLFSSARYMAYGEENEFTCMVTLPGWYLKLGKNPEQRQRKYRQMLDRFQVGEGSKPDPKKTRGNFIGGDLWVEAMRNQVREWLRQKKGSSDDEPSDTS
jgi:REP element-mobilizing transposase RayT